MKTIKGQYINLADESLPEADLAEVKFDLDSQEVRLSRRSGRRFRACSRGIPLWEGKGQRKSPWINLSGFIQVLLNPVSYLLAAIGLVKRYASGGGEANGA